MNDVMVDLEALGTSADAVIMSIGAVKFNLQTGEVDNEGFYQSVSVESNHALGRRVSEDTLIWWMKQAAVAQQVFFEPKVTLETALVEFSDWVSTDKALIWSNGADFDIAMLAHAYTQLSIEVPWKFWNARCVRTFKNLPGAKDISFESAGVKHNALGDALNQARQVIAIHQELFPSAVVAPKKINRSKA